MKILKISFFSKSFKCICGYRCIFSSYIINITVTYVLSWVIMWKWSWFRNMRETRITTSYNADVTRHLWTMEITLETRLVVKARTVIIHSTFATHSTVAFQTGWHWTRKFPYQWHSHIIYTKCGKSTKWSGEKRKKKKDKRMG